MTYFFIHTPKTSGTSFTEVLRKDNNNKVGFFYPPQQNMLEFEKRIKEGPIFNLKKNPNWEENNFIVGHFTYGIHEILEAKQYKYLGVYRHPVNHYVSMYKNFLRMDKAFQNALMPEGVSLENLLKLDYTHNLQTFFLSGLSKDEIKKDKKRALEVCITNIENDFVGLYPTNRFDEALFYFKNKIGIKPLLAKNRNVSKKEENIEIPEEILDKITAATNVDFMLYEYLENKFNREIKEISLGLDYKWYKLKKMFA